MYKLKNQLPFLSIMIAILEYGMGNIRSVQKALKKIGVESVITNEKELIEEAEGLIIPGVGHFGQAMENLNQLGLTELIRKKKEPILGICLGMQLLFSSSEEASGIGGLRLIKGKVIRFRGGNIKLPHIGWNNVYKDPDDPDGKAKTRILDGIEDNSDFYFVHSYHATLEKNMADKDEKVLYSDYGYQFVSAYENSRIFATQFHPEKSQDNGMRILKNFVRVVTDVKD